MPQPSHNPLFQEKTLDQAIKGFLFPADIADRHQKFLQWIAAIDSGTLGGGKGTSLHDDLAQDGGARQAAHLPG